MPGRDRRAAVERQVTLGGIVGFWNESSTNQNGGSITVFNVGPARRMGGVPQEVQGARFLGPRRPDVSVRQLQLRRRGEQRRRRVGARPLVRGVPRLVAGRTTSVCSPAPSVDIGMTGHESQNGAPRQHADGLRLPRHRHELRAGVRAMSRRLAFTGLPSCGVRTGTHGASAGERALLAARPRRRRARQPRWLRPSPSRANRTCPAPATAERLHAGARFGVHGFIGDTASLGGGLIYTDTDKSYFQQPAGTLLGIAPRVGYAIPFSPTLALWLRAGITYLTESISGGGHLVAVLARRGGVPRHHARLALRDHAGPVDRVGRRGQGVHGQATARGRTTARTTTAAPSACLSGSLARVAALAACSCARRSAAMACSCANCMRYRRA